MVVDRDGGGDGVAGEGPADALLRRTLGEVAFELASSAEGRAAAVSVEIDPDEGVRLRVRSGHELRLFTEARADEVWIAWERTDPTRAGARVASGDLGPSATVDVDDLRQFVARWLGWRTQG
ncbi:MAG: hypothetical protein KDK70_02925 [Myxococcales bacterium]|nr:hypothetical protein [Myxococcales bacterium]